MPVQIHVSETQKAQKLYNSLKIGEDRSVLVDGDLSSASAAKTAIQADVDKLHVSERHIAPRVKAGIDNAEQFLTGYNSGSDVSDYDVLPSHVQKTGQTVVF